MYEGWVEDMGTWFHYPENTNVPMKYKTKIYETDDGLTEIVIYDNNMSSVKIINSRLDNFFLDIKNPTKQELIMFQLQYGIDLNEPLGVKK